MPSISPGRLFCFGLGYSARALAGRLRAEGWAVAGTCRSDDARARLAADGMAAVLFDRDRPLADAAGALDGVTHILSSVPPDAAGDAVLDHHASHIRGLGGGTWIGYLSTTGVYGDTGGAAVDETATVAPTSERSERRVAAEAAWLGLAPPAHVFRLAGIYGPGRSALEQARGGTARRIHKPGHAFSRIHVDDIAAVLRASMQRPDPGRLYNVADDMPAEPAAVTAYAAELLGVAPPPAVPFEEAAKDMSPLARSFWRDNRRVDNRRIKEELGVTLAHPDYKSGLAAILAAILAAEA